MENEEKIEYSYTDSANIHHDAVLQKSMFSFNQADKKIHDVKLNGKPTTFARDALKRFSKNKSSIVAAIILGIMVLLALLLPVCIPYDTNTAHADETFLEPKLFRPGTGFWDGCKSYSNQTYDPTTGLPTGNFDENAIIKGSLATYEGTTDRANKYAKGGYYRIGDAEAAASLTSPAFTYDATKEYVLSYDMSVALEPEEYEDSAYGINLTYTDASSESKSIEVLADSSKYGEQTVTLNSYLVAAGVLDKTDIAIQYATPSEGNSVGTVYLKSSVLKEAGVALSDASFTDANAMVLGGAWHGIGSFASLFGATQTSCSFRYDTYEAKYGLKTMVIGASILDEYIQKGYMNYNFDVGVDSFQILSDSCPITKVYSQKVSSGLGVVVKEATCQVSYYRYMGYSKMPFYLFGTDNTGRDLLKYLCEGTRNSLALGVIIFLITFSFGLVFGAIEGYFGGSVDMAMERLVDILGNIPWIIVVTLCVLNLGQSFGVFILAMSLTGWISTSSLTRTQFYRFKRREYVLASRSLGASDNRLIFKHILPNAIGTIVTSAVLIIPSVIFDEAAVSYLGIGLKGMASLGVILSNNQVYLGTYNFLLLIPSVVMALLMITFNLFGNGLRDAFNPSLKGAD
ncbi:MAG: ABC transporter permease [Bacilli bacterium]